MRRVTLATVLACALVPLTAATALATHNEPQKAKLLKGNFVTAYEECTVPNTITDSFGLPACVPAVRSDPICGFGPKGQGKAIAKVTKTGDIAIKMKLKGLDAGCIGETLTLHASLRVTSDDCGGASCSVVTLNNFGPLASCVVDPKGKCQIKTTINTQIPGFLKPNRNTGIGFLDLSFWRFYPLFHTFQLGWFIP